MTLPPSEDIAHKLAPGKRKLALSDMTPSDRRDAVLSERIIAVSLGRASLEHRMLGRLFHNPGRLRSMTRSVRIIGDRTGAC